MSARPQSVNDEIPVAPRIRRDQRRRVSEIVRSSGAEPLVAIGLVRDFLKGHAVQVSFDSDTQPTAILVTAADADTKMLTQYQYRLVPHIRLETPTL